MHARNDDQPRRTSRFAAIGFLAGIAAPAPVVAVLMMTPLVTCDVAMVVASMLFCPAVALLCGHLAWREIRAARGTVGGRLLTTGGLVTGYGWILCAACTIFVLPALQTHVRKIMSRSNLENLYTLHKTYAGLTGKYPAIPPYRYIEKPCPGVRNLYPLLASGILKAEWLSLLQPEGLVLQRFPNAPSLDDFTPARIGYCYNASAQTACPPAMVLMCDQGQTNGIILRNAPPENRPLYTSGLNVLFTDGRIEWIEADRKGILSTNLVPADQWSLLVK